jgi:hypothetical protein
VILQVSRGSLTDTGRAAHIVRRDGLKHVTRRARYSAVRTACLITPV